MPPLRLEVAGSLEHSAEQHQQCPLFDLVIAMDGGEEAGDEVTVQILVVAHLVHALSLIPSHLGLVFVPGPSLDLLMSNMKQQLLLLQDSNRWLARCTYTASAAPPLRFGSPRTVWCHVPAPWPVRGTLAGSPSSLHSSKKAWNLFWHGTMSMSVGWLFEFSQYICYSGSRGEAGSSSKQVDRS